MCIVGLTQNDSGIDGPFCSHHRVLVDSEGHYDSAGGETGHPRRPSVHSHAVASGSENLEPALVVAHLEDSAEV